ncbi:MAG: hypothetical protein LW595_04785 [Rickettsiales bacterium]|nr:hypothetical protein [Rickettsiales bacterium]
MRRIWNEEKEERYFSVVDAIEVLTESPRPRKYWNVLKAKLKNEGSELSQNLGQLKMLSPDGKFYKTYVATIEQLFRLIQSIPSKKLSPLNCGWQKLAVKGWMKCKTQNLLLIGL